jgi:FKBP-type peptidyl-prolyl cis-trans isomerase (trigger factor)
MKVNVEKLAKSTIKLTISVPVEKVKEAYDAVLEDAIEKTNIEGFRKGNAPKKMVEEKVGVSNLYGDVINNLLQVYYPQAVKENHVNAIANPKVEIKEFEIDKDFEFVATTAVRPEIKLGDYRKELEKAFKNKRNEAKKENKDKLKKGEKLEEPHVHLNSNDVVEALLNTGEVEPSDIIVDDEAERLMSRLVDQAQNIGLSLDQYLKSQNKTVEQLREDYKKSAQKNVKAEFLLSEAVNNEKIKVEEAEIFETVKASGIENAEEKLKDPVEFFYVKSILQKNKLITKLIQETEGEHHHGHK